MTAFIVLAIYLAIGGGTAALILRGDHPGSATERARAAAFGLLLWPYTLPFVLQGPTIPDDPRSDTTGSGRSAEIHGREQRLEQTLQRAKGAADIDLERVAGMAARLGRRLRSLDARAVELEHAISDAHASVRGPLESLRERSQDELASGLRLMDELTGKLTLLAFADLGGSATHSIELEEVRTLLSRLEAMASATREVAAVHP